jgi:tetratricopeptide (TPR) repeat protein
MNDEHWQGINLKGGNPIIKDNVFNYLSSERQQTKLNPPQSIPYTGVANFVGRQQELETLHQTLQQRDTVAISAVAGMGGIGKTELATQYARRYQDDYPGGICWLTARDTDLAAEIVQFALLKMNLKIPQELVGRPLNYQQQVDWCWNHWQPPEGLILVVLDDVNDWGNCREILPNSNRFRVLITTRLRNIDLNLVEEISLEVLSTDAAVELLTALLGKRDKRVQREPQTAKDLCERLGNLPLGLHLVGQYLANDPDLSLAEMLNRLTLQDEALNPPEEQLQQTVSLAQRGVKAAFELSWQELDLTTQKIAEFLSLFAPSIIPWELVEFINESLNWEETAVNEAKKQLYKRHFIEQLEGKEGCYKIHPLIREFLQEKLASSEQTDEFKQSFATKLVEVTQVIPYSPTLDFITFFKDVIPHLEEVASYLTKFLKDEDLIWSFIGVGKFYEGQGLYALAEPWAKKCLSAAKNRFGNDHPDVATSLNNLAALYYSQGCYSKAEQLYLQALELLQRLLGNDHPSVATSLNNLAGLYQSQGRYSEAEQLNLQALKLRQHLLSNDHPDVATSLNNLASLYNSQGRYSEAEQLNLQALKLRQCLLGNDHPDVTTSLNNLAEIYNSQGRYSEAEPLYLQALKLRQRLLGNDHPDLATSLNNLAVLYKSQGRYSEAESLYLQALKLRQRLLENNHPDVTTSLNNLASLYQSQGSYSKAESLYLQALELRRRLWDNDHPSVATSLNNLATLYYSQGRYSEAEPLYLQALELCEQVWGVNHPNTFTTSENLAYLQAQRSIKNSKWRSWRQTILYFIDNLINKICGFWRRRRN